MTVRFVVCENPSPALRNPGTDREPMSGWTQAGVDFRRLTLPTARTARPAGQASWQRSQQAWRPLLSRGC